MHCQNLTDDRLPLWRHGRAWLGKLHWEWNVFMNPAFGFMVGKGGYFEDRVYTRIEIVFFTLYVSFSMGGHLEARELGFAFHHGYLWISLWRRSWDENWDDKREQSPICLHVSDWVFGKQKYHHEEFEKKEVLIPMPEGCYKAVATRFRTMWTWPRKPRVVKEGWDFDIPGGIPFSGKGENSWDCGDDGLFGVNVEGSLEKGIGRIVTSVLESRAKYGETMETQGKYVMAREW